VEQIEFTLRARRQILRATSWWLKHRDKAPAALEDDLNDAFTLLLENPYIGIPYRTRGGRARRLLLPRVRYYIYFRLTDDRITILSLWHSSRRPPSL
jgi:plasmid stabilization system protein ParE